MILTYKLCAEDADSQVKLVEKLLDAHRELAKVHELRLLHLRRAKDYFDRQVAAGEEFPVKAEIEP